MNTPQIKPSAHLLDVMSRRDVSWSEVVATIEDPWIVEPPHEGRRRFHRGALCVVLAQDGTVVTVLLREQKQWRDSDARARIRE